MGQAFLVGAALAVLVALVAAVVFTVRTVRWGASREECSARMPGDACLSDDGRPVAVMTRAVTIRAKPATVWPWLAQCGRGAGWYSYDRLDNGGKRSAAHIVSWVPEPSVGDASPIGYVRHLEAGTALTWATDETSFLRSRAKLAYDMRLTPAVEGSRLVIRISADATGGAPRAMLLLFRFLDSIMARRQLIGIRQRAEEHGARTVDPDHPETGARDQYQHHEVIYASGQTAGTPGREEARRWHAAAVRAGLARPRIERGRDEA